MIRKAVLKNGAKLGIIANKTGHTTNYTFY